MEDQIHSEGDEINFEEYINIFLLQLTIPSTFYTENSCESMNK